MSANWEQQVRAKTITAAQWADMVKSGDWIYTGGPGSDPIASIEALCPRLGDGDGQLRDIEIWTQCSTLFAPLLSKADPEARFCLLHEYFFTGQTRKWNDATHAVDWGHWGWSAGMCYLYSRWARQEQEESAIDWAVISASLPERGMVNLSYGVANSMTAVRSARKVVVELRSDYPWCEPGRNMLLPIEDVDYFIEVDVSKPEHRWPQMDEAGVQLTDADRSIAKHILSIRSPRFVTRVPPLDQMEPVVQEEAHATDQQRDSRHHRVSERGSEADHQEHDADPGETAQETLVPH